MPWMVAVMAKSELSVTQKYVETNLLDLNGYNTFTLKDYKLGLIVTVRPT